MKYFESNLADEVYQKLFGNKFHQNIVWDMAFPEAELNHEFAYIKLNNEYVIKIEKV